MMNWYKLFKMSDAAYGYWVDPKGKLIRVSGVSDITNNSNLRKSKNFVDGHLKAVIENKLGTSIEDALINGCIHIITSSSIPTVQFVDWPNGIQQVAIEHAISQVGSIQHIVLINPSMRVHAKGQDPIGKMMKIFKYRTVRKGDPDALMEEHDPNSRRFDPNGDAVSNMPSKAVQPNKPVKPKEDTLDKGFLDSLYEKSGTKNKKNPQNGDAAAKQQEFLRMIGWA